MSVSFGQRWAAAGQFGAEVPAGNYDVEIIDASASLRQSDNAEYVKVVLLIESGEQRGHSVDQILMLIGNQAERARETLTMYGLSLINPEPTWGEFQQAVAALIGVKANVSLSYQDNGWRNVKVNTSQLPLTEQHAPEPAAPQSVPVAAGDDDDSIPF
jgi:hypothetical protein